MFTGLIQKLGHVATIEPDGQGGSVLAIAEAELAPLLVLGESVAVNGVCLTVTGSVSDRFSFQVGPETLLRSNLGKLRPGDRVNLERALRMGDSLGGHIVSGHVDAIGTIESITIQGDWRYFEFRCPVEFDALMVNKGSIAIDGISLTVVDTRPGFFRVMLIPHTLSMTTLGDKTIGSEVNLEADLLAKHVQKLLHAQLQTPRV